MILDQKAEQYLDSLQEDTPEVEQTLKGKLTELFSIEKEIQSLDTKRNSLKRKLKNTRADLKKLVLM